MFNGKAKVGSGYSDSTANGDSWNLNPIVVLLLMIAQNLMMLGKYPLLHICDNCTI